MSACTSSAPLGLGPLEDLDRLALAHLDDRLLPARLLAAHEAAALRLGLHFDDVHALDVDVEELLDGLPDLRLVRVRMDAERVLALIDQLVALLGHDRREENLVRMEAHEALPCTSSSAASLISSERAQTTCLTSRSAGAVTTTRSRLRNDLIRPSSSGFATRRSGSSFAHAPRKVAAAFVDGSSNPPGSTTPSVSPWACADSAPRSAARRAFRFTFTSKLRPVGGKAMPPPVQCGARIEPARARPVPFWRHGCERPPATSPRLFPPRVAERAEFCSARTVSCTRCGFTSAPKTSASSVRLLADFPPLSRTATLGAATVLVLSDLDDPVLGARHRALDQEQVPLRVDLVHGQPYLRDSLTAQAPGHLLTLQDPRRRRRGADRAGLADVVRPVRLRPAVEPVALDRARKALADPDPGDLHALAGLEGLDGHGLALDELARAAELDELRVRTGLA